ncbi:MAG: 4-oxalocrotonate decarboxylase [Proteobacteria bacterium]|nr:4-oxalocrotonate decarboxylase [Pseudomonadota bacterium]
MNKSLFFKAIILSWVSLCCDQLFAQDQALSKRLSTAHAKGERLPNLSRETNIDMAGAYDIQASFVKDRLTRDKIAGFKAGLTNESSQAHLGINRPIFGVLFKSGVLAGKPVISLSSHHNVVVETELGFITKKPITHNVNSSAELKTYISHVVPVIELPDIAFVSDKITAQDLVAGNTGSSAYLIHPNVNWYGQDINGITVSLMHNGMIVNQGQGIDAMGDQWEALRWLVNQVLAHGWTIEKDYLLITGALGEMVEAKPGTYTAQFNDGATMEVKFKS